LIGGDNESIHCFDTEITCKNLYGMPRRWENNYFVDINAIGFEFVKGMTVA
jgi:hypothetical protein